MPHPLGGDRGGGAGVVGSRDEHERVRRLELVDEQRRRPREELERRLADPAERWASKPSNETRKQRVRAAARNRRADLLEQGPGQRIAADEHLPAGLDTEAAVDDQLRVLAVTRVGHRTAR